VCEYLVNSTAWFHIYILTPYTSMFGIALGLIWEGGAGRVVSRV